MLRRPPHLLIRPTGIRGPPSEGPRRPQPTALGASGGRFLRTKAGPPLPLRPGPMGARCGAGLGGFFFPSPPPVSSKPPAAGAWLSAARPRRPVCPSCPTTEPVAGFRRPSPACGPAQAAVASPDDTVISPDPTLTASCLFDQPPQALRKSGVCGVGKSGQHSHASRSPGWSPDLRVLRLAALSTPVGVLWATWLILPVAYACLKD